MVVIFSSGASKESYKILKAVAVELRKHVFVTDSLPWVIRNGLIKDPGIAIVLARTGIYPGFVIEGTGKLLPNLFQDPVEKELT